MDTTQSYIDSGKRGRVIVLTFLTTVSIFVIRAFELVDPTSVWQMLGLSASYFALTYLGLIWAFRFQVTKSSLLLVIPQSAFFATAQMAFVMLFFFRNFERVYEFFLLFVLLVIIFITTYVTFLMSNIFNVATFKQIPLVQVAKTTSYIISILIVYFVSFALLAQGIPFPAFISVLAVLYFCIVLFHISHLRESIDQKKIIILFTTVCLVIMVVPTVFIGSRFELSALIPAVVAFVLLGAEMHSNKQSKNLNIFIRTQYLVITLIVVAINLLLQ
jgi:hypothetical protein